NGLCYPYTGSKHFKACWGSRLQAHTKGSDAMSWLVVFISSFVPIVLLFILLITDWLHGEPRSKLSSLSLWGGMKEQDRWDGFADSKLLTQFLILAGSVTLAIAQGIVMLLM